MVADTLEDYFDPMSSSPRFNGEGGFLPESLRTELQHAPQPSCLTNTFFTLLFIQVTNSILHLLGQ